MRNIHLSSVALLCLAPASAMALGLDRSGQSVDVMFEDGNYFQFSVNRAFPSVDGVDTLSFDTGDVAENFTSIEAGIKFQVTEKLSLGLMANQPYGADISYPSDGSVLLGGSNATVDSRELIALARYRINDSFSVHGGLRYTHLESDTLLSGAAYGGLSGYAASFDEDGDTGFVAGFAYERPEIALRIALTYFQGTEHDLNTTESLNGVDVGDLPGAAFGLPINPFSTETTTTVETADALNIDFQTGINARTLLFGQIRYAWYENVESAPAFFDALSDPDDEGTSLIDIEDNYSITLGVGRQLTERLSGIASVSYEPEEDDDLVSPLSPTNGQTAFGLGMSYAVTDRMTLAGGLRYVWLGDAQPETGTPDVARASFEDNHVVGLGLQVGYSF